MSIQQHMDQETLRDVLSPLLEEERRRAADRRDQPRECRVLGCGTRLSRYNPGERCSIHTEPDYRIPARR
jgi:hypothetical protein